MTADEGSPPPKPNFRPLIGVVNSGPYANESAQIKNAMSPSEGSAQAVLSAQGLQALIEALRSRGYRVIGPTVRDGRSSTTTSPRSTTCPRAGPTSRTADATGWSRATTTPCSATPSARTPGRSSSIPPSQRLWRARARRRRPSRSTPEPDPRGALRLHRRARLRAARDRDPGPGVPRRPLRRPALPRAARRRLHRRGQLRRGGRHLLLRLDGHRAQRRSAASTSR